MQTESQKEYQEVIDFYEKFIKQNHYPCEGENVQNEEYWLDFIDSRLTAIFGKPARIFIGDDNITINGRNRYEIFLNANTGNFLIINGILSNKEFNYASRNQNIFQKGQLEIEIREGGNGYYDTIWGTLYNIKSKDFNNIDYAEVNLIKNNIVDFIEGVELFKDKAKDFKF